MRYHFPVTIVVAKGTISSVEVSGTSTAWRLGCGTTGSTQSGDLLIDDIASGQVITDYPLGAGQIVGLLPNRDGTHSYGASADFLDTTDTGISPATTSSYT